MFNISKFLDKFLQNIDSNDVLKNAIVDTIFKISNIKTNINDIEVKNNIIFLKANPLVKNKLFIYKEKILTELNSLTKLNFLDIR